MTNKFESALKKTLNDEVAISENGAMMFKTAGNPLLDINFAVSSLRNKDVDEIERMFSDAFYFDSLLAVKWLFMLRDVRGGMGERRTFRICFAWLASVKPELVKRLIPLVAEYGRWDDLLNSGLKGELWDAVIDVIAAQLKNDLENVDAEKPISLLAKWLPSVNTSSPKTRALAKKLRRSLGMDEKTYRKSLSKLRAYLKLVEVNASANTWSSIDYNAVPSHANLKYKNAFLKHDNARRLRYLDQLMNGNAKINSNASFPSDIVHAYGNTYYGSKDPALEAMWKALPNVAVNGNVLTVCDGSGSMTMRVSGNLEALEICNALGIYCAEHCTGPFKNKYITFSSRPQYVDLSNAKSLFEKLKIAYSHSECSNTNLEAVFDLVLETAVRFNLKQEDIPTLVILSDMEIDAGCDFGHHVYSITDVSSYNARKVAFMENVRKKWENAGYKLPRLIWWNIASRTGVVPMQQNPDTGIILCSGYSQNTFKMLASNKTDPYDVLVEAINNERYKPVEDAFTSI